ncbi:MAG: 50S ribosomal protein L4 [Mycoplasmataceae bacterium]|jgi:large subunit ribosomal protein L4|nr:50S ribosomal protein L4 [Mycoplasmataceae bacterium]
MTLTVVDLQGQTVGTVELDPKLLVDHVNKQAIFEQIIAENAAQRQGTYSTLTRGEVRGGGKKPRPQKHTNKSQLGSTRASHCVGGGVAFGPKPGRNYKLYLNAKANQLALKSALTLKAKQNQIIVLDDQASLAKPNTKTIATLLKKLQFNQNALIITDSNIINKSAQNLARAIAKKPTCVSVKDIVNAHNLLIQKAALAAFGKAGK